MKNFVLISPHFPETYYQFAQALKDNGFNVLGIGDCPYNQLNQNLKNALTEYYGCWGMDNFENEIKAVQYFQDKYGHIDYLESNNEFWLRRDASLREWFNIDTGIRGDQINVYQHKSRMKEKYLQAGVKVARFILINDNRNDLEEFIKEVGYPVFAKPDLGVGAEGDFKISNNEDLEAFFAEKAQGITYICEQFVTGNIISFDGIADSNSDVVFCTSNFFPPSISDIVKEHKDVMYYTLPKCPEDLEKIGRAVIKAFEVKKRFFHLEFFRLTQDVKGLAKKGEIVALETNMRPAGGYTPDLINYANSVNCYKIWADVMAFDENRQDLSKEKFYACCASRRFESNYAHSDTDVLTKYKNQICNFGVYPKVFSGAMGDKFYMAKFKTLDELKEFADYVALRIEDVPNKVHFKNLTGEDIDMFNERKQEDKASDGLTICDKHVDGA